MGNPIARIGDTGVGTCYAHDSPQQFVTVFTTGSGTVTCDGIPVCITGTIGVTSCGHTTQAMTGSGTVVSDGISVHRVGDTGIVIEDPRGTYTCASGSGQTTSGG